MGGPLRENHEIARGNRCQLSIRYFRSQRRNLNDRLGVGDGVFVVCIVVNQTAGYLDKGAGSLDNACKKQEGVEQ